MSTDEPEQWRLACGVDEGFCRELLQVRVKGEMRVSHPSGADESWVGSVFLPLNSQNQDEKGDEASVGVALIAIRR
jgi:hypothetical protein